MKKLDLKGDVYSDTVGKFYERYHFPAIYPSKVTDALRDAKGDDVEIDLSSRGGSVDAAREIYTALMSYEGNVKIHVVGLAASAASMIMCARECDISPVGQVMIHCCSADAWGNHVVMEKMAEILKSYDSTIIPAYIKKTGMNETDIRNIMERESWITAEEAVKLGFCDAIMGADKADSGDVKISDVSGSADNAAALAIAKMNFLNLKGANYYGY